MSRGFWRSLWAIMSYIPLAYFSKDIVGYFPYSFVTFDNVSSYLWLAAVVLLNQLSFYGFGSLNNHFKEDSSFALKEFLNFESLA